MKKYWKEFVAFVMTGNVLMLAVAFVMGGLTKKVIDDFVAFIVNPIIGAIVGKPEFPGNFRDLLHAGLLRNLDIVLQNIPCSQSSTLL